MIPQPSRQRQTIILLGVTGSGKSLMTSILTKLPKSVVLDENYLPPYLAHLKGFLGEYNDKYKLSIGLKSHLENVVRYGQNSRLAVSIQCIQGKVGIREWLGSLFSSTRTIETVILESHYFSLAPQMLFDAYPNAKFILMMRDGRDVADKLEREHNALSDEDLSRSDSNQFFFKRIVEGESVPWWVKESDAKLFLNFSPFHRSLYYWRIVNERLFSFEALHSKETVLILKYEDLAQESAKTRSLLVNFLGVERKALSLSDFNKISSSRIGEAKQYRTSEELDMADNIGGQLLSKLKYL